MIRERSEEKLPKAAKSPSGGDGLRARRSETNSSPKNRVEVRDFSTSVTGRCSTQAKETRCRSLLPSSEQDVTRAVALRDCAQSHRIFWRWLSGTAALHLNKDYLQGIPAPGAMNW